MVALLTSVRNSPCFGGLRRTKTCHRQLFARPSVFLRYFLHAAKSTNPFPRREFRGFANLESAHQNNNFPLTKLNPFETFRFAESLSLPGRHTACAFSAALGGDSFRLRRCHVAAATTFVASRLFLRLRRFFKRHSRLFVLPAATDRRSAATFSYFL